MNNKNCGCQSGAGYQFGCGCDGDFVPVVGNWNFNMEGCGRQNRCNVCQDQTEARNDCGCERRETPCQEKQRGVQPARCARNTCTGMADCTCEACLRRRQTEAQPCARQKKNADNRGVGIMWGKRQALDKVFDCEHALKAGTLYPELHMPLNGYWPCEENCADCKQEAAFALWELRLYLNTHPCDQEALALFRQLWEKAEGTYAASFLPKECARWAWTDDPWPWEYECQCRSGSDCHQ